jgi:hypothetical protein
MAAFDQIDKEARIVWTTGNGVLDFADAIGHMRSLSKDPDFDPAFSQLLDFREVSEIRLSHDEIDEKGTEDAAAQGDALADGPRFHGIVRRLPLLSVKRRAVLALFLAIAAYLAGIALIPRSAWSARVLRAICRNQAQLLARACVLHATP